VPHAGVKEVSVEVELRKNNGVTKVLHYDYPDVWNNP
jgi:hypothetical protein